MHLSNRANCISLAHCKFSKFNRVTQLTHSTGTSYPSIHYLCVYYKHSILKIIIVDRLHNKSSFELQKSSRIHVQRLMLTTRRRQRDKSECVCLEDRTNCPHCPVLTVNLLPNQCVLRQQTTPQIEQLVKERSALLINTNAQHTTSDVWITVCVSFSAA